MDGNESSDLPYTYEPPLDMTMIGRCTICDSFAEATLHCERESYTTCHDEVCDQLILEGDELLMIGGVPS